MAARKQLFLSHAWRPLRDGRCAHALALALSFELEQCGWTVWIDAHDMFGNVDAAMVRGIDECDAVVVCLTRAYHDKVNGAVADATTLDNCCKEWKYAHARRKPVVAVVVEPHMRDPSTWTGVVAMQLASSMYVDGTSGGCAAARLLTNALARQHAIHPANRARDAMRARLAEHATRVRTLVATGLSPPRARPAAGPARPAVAVRASGDHADERAFAGRATFATFVARSVLDRLQSGGDDDAARRIVRECDRELLVASVDAGKYVPHRTSATLDELRERVGVDVTLRLRDDAARDDVVLVDVVATECVVHTVVRHCERLGATSATLHYDDGCVVVRVATVLAASADDAAPRRSPHQTLAACRLVAAARCVHLLRGRIVTHVHPDETLTDIAVPAPRDDGMAALTC